MADIKTTACEIIHPAAYVLNQLKKCFKLEQDWKTLSPKERLVQRKAELKPRMDALYRYVGEISAVPTKSKLDKAIQYFMNYRKDLERVFEDGRLELTNNQSERLIKDLVMGEKELSFLDKLRRCRGSWEYSQSFKNGRVERPES